MYTRFIDYCGGKDRAYFTFSILLFAVLSAFSPHRKFISYIYFIFIAIPWLLFSIKERKIFIPKSYEFSAWGLFLAWIAIQSSFLAVVTDARYIRYAIYVAVFVATIACLASSRIFRSEKFARNCFWILVVFSLISFFVDLYKGSWYPGGRILFMQPDTSPYFHAYLLNMLFALLLPRLVSSNRFIELLFTIGALCFVNAVCFGSRSALLGMIVVFLVYFVLSVYFKSKNILLYIGIVIFCSALVYICWREFAFLHSLIDRADSARFMLWRSHFENFMQFNGLHFGLGHQYINALSLDADLARPHNLFLGILVYHGIWALLLFLILCALSLHRACRNRDPWGCVLLVGLAEAAFMSENIVGYPNTFWITILLPMALVLNTSSMNEDT